MDKGDRVYYTSRHGSKENGIIKRIEGRLVFVVYHCNEDWGNYENYTGAATNIEDLQPGWVDENGKILPEFCNHEYRHTNAKWQPINQMECINCGHIIE